MTKKALYVDSTSTPIDIPGYEKMGSSKKL